MIRSFLAGAFVLWGGMALAQTEAILPTPQMLPGSAGNLFMTAPNADATLSFGGNFTTNGAYALQFNTSAATTITLPSGSFTVATAGANSNITSLTGLTTPLSAAQGGTGASSLTGYLRANGASAATASTTIPNTAITGLGTMSTQTASSVAITGGTVDGTTIGGTTPGNGTFSTFTDNGIAYLPYGVIRFGCNTCSDYLFFNEAAGSGQLSIQTAGVSRWNMFVNGANTGSNAGDNILWTAYSDTGSAIGSLFEMHRSPFEVVIGGQLYQNFSGYALSGSLSPQTSDFYTNTVSGSSSSSQIYNNFQVYQDSSTTPGSTDLETQMGFGGNSFTGGVIASGNYFNMRAATNAAHGTFYTLSNNYAKLSYNAGGTAPGYTTTFGALYGVLSDVILASGATNYSELVGEEIDNEIDSGASVYERSNLKLTLNAASQGTGEDEMLGMDTNAGSVGAKYGIELGNADGAMPITGTIMGISYSGHYNSNFFETPQTGIDFSEADFQQYAWESAGARIDPKGDYQIGPGALSWSPAGGVTLVSTGYTGGSAGGTLTPASGGAGYVDGSIGTSGNGDLYTVHATSGAITSLTILVPASSQSTPPSNPVTITADGQITSSATVNLTWTAATTTTIGGAGSLQFGSGAFTANGSTSVSLTSIAPSGAHATVQEWLTVKDSSGTVRYIPAF